MLKPQIKYLPIFWPPIVYIAIFGIYTILVLQFYTGQIRGESWRVLLPATLMGCFGMPSISVVQLIFSGLKRLRNPGSNYMLHLYSAIAGFLIFAVFFLSLHIGNYPTV